MSAWGSQAAEAASSLQIARGLPAGSAAEAARLYWLAFGGKLGPVMGPEARAIRFIERVLSPAHALSATRDGRLLGVIGVRGAGGAFVGGTASDLRAVYGRFGGSWRRLAFSVVADELPADTLAIDGLAVDTEARGQGVGAALIGALAGEARRQGYTRLRLEVAAGNPRARRLYERLGFEVASETRSALSAALFHVHTRTRMELALG